MTLLTDYGLEAGFVGSLHAVAFSIAPGVRVIDLDHSVPPQDVRLGAIRLRRMMRFTPPGVHVAVVDPGVGGSRRAVALAAGDRLFVGPDNGLLLDAARAEGQEIRAVELDEESYFQPHRASTFDGRDIFVPVAAHLAIGVALETVGSLVEVESLVEIEGPWVEIAPDRLSADTEVIQVDGFGNVQLSATPNTLRALSLEAGGTATLLSASGAEVTAPVGRTFADVERGKAVLLVDSDGQVALSVNGGRADALLAAKPWSQVTIRKTP